MDKDQKCYYLRFETTTEYLNLLYVPHTDFGREQINQSLMRLLNMYADPQGAVAYFDAREACIVAIKTKDIGGLRIYEYDDSAPYDGYYLDGRFIEAMEDM